MYEIELPELINKFQLGRGVHLIASLFGGIFLILVWAHAKREIKKLAQDWGLVLLACGLLMWVAIDAYKFLKEFSAAETSFVMKIFSAFNNAFFIAALPFFKYGFDKIKEKFPYFRNGEGWALSVFLANVVVIVFYAINWDWEKDSANELVKHFDTLYSMATLGILGYAITQAFKGRKQYGNAFVIVSVIISILLVSTQLIFSPFFKISPLDYPALLMYSSHIALIALLLVLAQSWIVEEQVENQKNKSKSLSDKLIEKEYKQNKSAMRINEQKMKIDELEAEILELESKLLDEKSNSNINKSKELSDREKDVIRIIAKSYKEIAQELFIEVETAKSHVKNIKNKLGLNDKSEVHKYARDNNLIDK